MADIVASVLTRLKNESKTKNIPLQQLLNLFCQEEFMKGYQIAGIEKI